MDSRRFRRSHYPSYLADTRCQGAVYSGPFEGMRYVEDAVGSAFYPKLLGTYELELHDIVETLIRRPFDTIIDIGAAEGYYACGFALADRNFNFRALVYDSRGEEELQRFR